MVLTKTCVYLCLSVQDYSLSQTTMDDVFIHFANEQSENAGLTLMPSGNSSSFFSRLFYHSFNKSDTLSQQLPDVNSIHETPP